MKLSMCQFALLLPQPQDKSFTVYIVASAFHNLLLFLLIQLFYFKCFYIHFKCPMYLTFT